MTAFYSVLVAINVLCAALILAYGIQRKRYQFVSLAALNGFSALFNWLSFSLLSATDISQALELSRWHLAVIIAAYPFYIHTFGTWSKLKHTNKITIAFIIFSIGLLAVNLLADYPLRYGRDAVLVEYTTIFNDTARVLVGETNALFPLIHFSYSVITIFLCFCVYRFYKEKRSLESGSLLVTILFQIFAAYAGFRIDSQQSSLVYLGAVPISMLSLATLVVISQAFRKTTSALEKEVGERSEFDRLFAALAKISNEGSGDQFFTDVMALLAKYCKADFAILGLIDKEDAKYIQTKCVFHQGVSIANFRYARRGTPCEQVISHDACVYPSKVWEHFPLDTMLKDELIQGYLGYPILDEQQQAVGLIALLFRTPLTDSKKLKLIADVFATRIGAEMRRSQLEQQLTTMAFSDYLTGLPNRTSLLKQTNHYQINAQHNNQDGLLMLFDIDHFGEINRKFGTDIGDQTLKIIGERLSHFASSSCFVARYGGDEFVVAFPTVKGEMHALVRTQWTALSAVFKRTCIVGNRKINLSCSMGAIMFPSQLHESVDIMGAAEHALVKAKQSGRDSYCLFEPAMIDYIEYSRSIEQELLQAITHSNELFMVYQPKVDRHNNLLGAEALVRWTSAKRGFISPAEFIPVAEETGAIHKLGMWITGDVCRQIRQWLDQGYELVPISINITSSQFDDPEFINHLLATIESFDIPYHLVELELTESGILKDKSRAVEYLTMLRDKGVTIALDDFGTGYSSLSYISDLPFDTLKIDKSFIDKLDDDKNKELVKSIISISKTLGVQFVAEGTETEQQVEIISSYGCQVFQGYFFSRPLPVDEFVEKLARTNN
ncbi:bifunctional diguanylate cyclase/phosphodiesterase [Neiella sp. HB171785]|uniref:Bifunctional diguanylate cyclase/phosphodiesterase n=1 Tax=Neiella litorisoli TaxID=2771431 RepID=A0A8J6QI36_9GAMM|nr:bifunctional diguanylate cyclase/phosphodiesterase [Neiella litorisoli]MBD1388958.1 bifunctional diguanylate cyclase/phosphodiesterase [Neiella litorisoli]